MAELLHGHDLDSIGRQLTAKQIVAIRLDRPTKIPDHVDPKPFPESVFGCPPDAKVASETADKNFLGSAILQIAC